MFTSPMKRVVDIIPVIYLESLQNHVYIYIRAFGGFRAYVSLLSVIQPEEEVERSPPAPCHCVPAYAIPQLASRDNIGKFNTANFP